MTFLFPESYMPKNTGFRGFLFDANLLSAGWNNRGAEFERTEDGHAWGTDLCVTICFHNPDL